jgi:hypothetical protein
MAKIRLEITHVFEYEPDLEDYGTDDLEEALRIDIANTKDDPLMMISYETASQFEVTGKIVED